MENQKNIVEEGGHVSRVRCCRHHSKSRLIVSDSDGQYSCTGCGEYYAADEVAEAQRAGEGQAGVNRLETINER